MEIVSVLMACLEQSSPLWNVEITKNLVEEKWEELKSQNSWDPNNYSTAGILLGDSSLAADRFAIPIDIDTEDIYIEIPSQEHLSNFYNENGLELYTKEELDSLESINIFNNAFTTISTVRPIFNCVTNLVRAIQILKPGDPDNDVSYSHPNIPFSIFVSICGKQTEEATLRIAESIIHEAMHLQLTLIEDHMAAVSEGAIPISSRMSPIISGVRSIRTPSASSTSALPLREVKDRFPCFAIGTPAPAATRAAAVEMLNVVTSPPPVPAVSTRTVGSFERTGIIAARSALTPPATSAGSTPLAWRAVRKAAI